MYKNKKESKKQARIYFCILRN